MNSTPGRPGTSDLLVPIALDASNAWILPEEALRHRDYWCPACHQIVRRRGGDVRRDHFFHLSDTTCTGETVIHLAAKQILTDLANRGEGFQLADTAGHVLPNAFFPLPIRADQEVLVGSYRADVGLYNMRAQLLGVIEVFVSHEVTPDKAENLPARWIEVSGHEVFTWFETGKRAQMHGTDHRPLVVRVLRSGGGWPLPTCLACLPQATTAAHPKSILGPSPRDHGSRPQRPSAFALDVQVRQTVRRQMNTWLHVWPTIALRQQWVNAVLSLLEARDGRRDVEGAYQRLDAALAELLTLRAHIGPRDRRAIQHSLTQLQSLAPHHDSPTWTQVIARLEVVSLQLAD